MFTETLGLLGLGFVLGLQHATDPDHIVAVSSLVTENKTIKTGSLIGIMWGLGHTTTLLLAGLIIMLLEINIPQKIALFFELIVGLMIFILGLRVIYKLIRESRARHAHKSPHDKSHLHPHLHPHLHSKNSVAYHHTHLHNHSHYTIKGHEHHRHSHYHQSYLVGIIHGLAGSASIMLLVLTTIASIPLGVLYIAIFGIGSMVGMALISGIISLPFALTSKSFEKWNRVIRYVTGIFSICFGIFLIMKIAFP